MKHQMVNLSVLSLSYALRKQHPQNIFGKQMPTKYKTVECLG